MLKIKKYTLIGVILYIAVISVSILFRTAYLTSDPPDNLSNSASIYVDESYRPMSIRNIIKFGSEKVTEYDEYASHSDTWLFYRAQSILLKTFGLNIVNLRYFNIVLSFIIIIMYLAMVSSLKNRKFQVVSGFLLCTNYMFLFNSRIGIAEFPLIFMWIVMLPPVLYFLKNYRDCNQKKVLTAITGVLFFIVLISYLGLAIKKSFFLYSAATLLSMISVFYINNRIGKSPDSVFSKRTFYVLFGVFAGFYLFFSLTQLQSAYLMRSVSSPEKLIWKIWVTEFIYLQPVTIIFALVFVKYTFQRINRNSDAAKNNFNLSADLFFSFQFIYTFIFVFISSYSPQRYYLMSLIPVFYLAANGIINIGNIFKESTSIKQPGRVRLILKNIMALFFIFQAGLFVANLFLKYEHRKALSDNFISLFRDNISSYSIYVYAGLVLITVFFIILLVFKLTGPVTAFFRNRLDFKKALTLVITMQMLMCLHFFVYRTKKIKNGMEFVNQLPKGTIIMGDWAPMLAFHSELKSVYSVFCKEYSINIKSLTKIRPDYMVVLVNKDEDKKYNEAVPGLIKRENLIYWFQLRQFRVHIYKTDLWRKDNAL